MDNTQILLHHLLQKYLVERDINFSLSEMLTLNVQLGYVLTRGGGASCRVRFILPPPPRPRISERMDNTQFLLHHLLQKYLVMRYKLYFSQSEMLTSNVQLGYILSRGGGQAVQGDSSSPPPAEFQR